jgi:hypothetical protein
VGGGGGGVGTKYDDRKKAWGSTQTIAIASIKIKIQHQTTSSDVRIITKKRTVKFFVECTFKIAEAIFKKVTQPKLLLF